MSDRALSRSKVKSIILFKISILAKTVHDQKLDRWGPRTVQHSVNPVPYDRRLGRKKKFANPKPKEVSLDNIKVWNTQQETDQYVRLCAGEDLRPQKVQDKLYCKYEHRNKPYYM